MAITQPLLKPGPSDFATTTFFFAERSKVKDVKRSEANPCGAASFAKLR